MSFPNPRLHTIPAERMRARCVLAERFVSAECISDNGGTVTGATVARGATISSGQSVVCNSLLCHDQEKLSLFVRFSAVDGLANLFSFAGTKFVVTFTDGVITASHATSDDLELTIDYQDGEAHTLLYSIDTGAGIHTLWCDGQSVSGSTSVAVTIAETSITFSGTQTHTIYRVLLYNAALDGNDFTVLSDERWTDFVKENLFSFWRCNSRSYDDIGNFLRDTFGDKKFLLGDGSTQSTIPELYTENGETLVTFDSAQYLSDEPDFPSLYTLSVAHSDTVYDGRLPSVTQEDSTKAIIESMGVAGGYSYENLHSIWISDRELLALEKLHIMHSQLYDSWRCSCKGAIHQLIKEGVCNFALLFNCNTMFRDIGHDVERYAINQAANINGDEFYVQFDGGGSRLELESVSDDQDLRELTWIIFGEISPATSTRVIISKSSFRWEQDSSTMTFAYSEISDSRLDNATEMLAVTAINGNKPRFFADEVYCGEGDSNVSLTYGVSNDWILGNSPVLSENLSNVNAKAFLAFNVALTDQEIMDVYYSLKKSFSYVKPPTQVSDIWFDSPGQTTIYNDLPGQVTIINDEVV